MLQLSLPGRRPWLDVLGATRSEVEEALGVAVYMGGGPSLMYAANAIGAFVEFSQAGAGG